MDHLAVGMLIPVAAIIMVGLSQIAREFTRGRHQQDLRALQAQMDTLEREVGTVRQQLSETQERLDFAERLLAQDRERRQLGASE